MPKLPAEAQRPRACARGSAPVGASAWLLPPSAAPLLYRDGLLQLGAGAALRHVLWPRSESSRPSRGVVSPRRRSAAASLPKPVSRTSLRSPFLPRDLVSIVSSAAPSGPAIFEPVPRAPGPGQAHPRGPPLLRLFLFHAVSPRCPLPPPPPTPSKAGTSRRRLTFPTAGARLVGRRDASSTTRLRRRPNLRASTEDRSCNRLNGMFTVPNRADYMHLKVLILSHLLPE